MSNTSSTQLDHLISDIRARRVLVVRGLTAIRELQEVLDRAIQEFGIHVTWDPSSEPSLVDFLGGVTVGALRGSLAGAGLGLLIGVLLGDVESGVMLGALAGATSGAVHGARKVTEGWRIRVWYNEAGIPAASVKVT